MQICSEDLNIPDRGFQKLHIIAKSFDMDLSILRPVQNSRINMIALTCKTDILRSKVLIIGIREMSLRNHRRSLSEYLPVSGSVYRLSVYLQPFSHFSQDMCILFRNCSIRLRSDIKKKCTIFADYIDQIQHYIGRLLIIISNGIAPGVLSYRRIILPQIRRDMV